MDRDSSKVKRAVIIGASSGIGRALALVLAREGYVLGLTARRIDLLRDLQQKIISPVFIRKMDLKNPDEAAGILEDLIKEMNGANLVVINSGIDVRDPDLNWKLEHEILNVNALGFITMASVAVKHFLAQGSGHLAGISSIAGIRGNGRSPVYAASKACISNFMEGLRQRLLGKNIRVTDIRPGFVDTPMIQGRKTAFWCSSAEKAAGQIYEAICQKKRIAYVSKRWFLIALLFKLVPGRFYDWAFDCFVAPKLETELREEIVK